MDPLSITASIAAVLQITGTIISYLSDVLDAPHDRMKLASELSGLVSLLQVLRIRIQQAKPEDPWFTTLLELMAKNHPLDQLESDLVLLTAKIEPPTGIKIIGKRLTWKFDKVEVTNILSKIERIKTLVTLALTNDLL